MVACKVLCGSEFVSYGTVWLRVRYVVVQSVLVVLTSVWLVYGSLISGQCASCPTVWLSVTFVVIQSILT